MNRYPLISRVILLQVLINLVGLLLILAAGFSLIKSFENKKIQEYRSSLRENIWPQYQTYISWHLLNMSILNEELHKLQQKYDLHTVAIRSASELKTLENRDSSLIVPDPNSAEGQNQDYFVFVQFKDEQLQLVNLPIHWYIIFGTVILLSVLIIFRFYRSIKMQLFTALNCVDQAIESIQAGNTPDFSYVSKQNEFSRFLSGMNVLYRSTKEIESSKSILSITKQVSHDIRSPLSALNMVVASLHEAPIEKRQMLKDISQRINDVANDLLAKSKELPALTKSSAKMSFKNEIQPDFISAIVESIVLEKCQQYQNHAGIQIDLKLKNCAHTLANVNRVELKRILSNLINNAVEALQNQNGQIEIEVTASREIEIVIRDNGCGMTPETVAKLGKLPFSLGKEFSSESGSGLGVFHAAQVIKSWGGRLEISSQLAEGSEFRIQLPIDTTVHSIHLADQLPKVEPSV